MPRGLRHGRSPDAAGHECGERPVDSGPGRAELRPGITAGAASTPIPTRSPTRASTRPCEARWIVGGVIHNSKNGLIDVGPSVVTAARDLARRARTDLRRSSAAVMPNRPSATRRVPPPPCSSMSASRCPRGPRWPPRCQQLLRMRNCRNYSAITYVRWKPLAVTTSASRNNQLGVISGMSDCSECNGINSKAPPPARSASSRHRHRSGLPG